MTGAPATCPACGIPPVRSFKLHNGEHLLRCPRCLLGWWSWPAFDPHAFYDRSYFQSGDEPKGYADYAALASALRRSAAGRLAVLNRLAARHRFSPSRRGDVRFLLDVGCGPGFFLDEARKRGWRTHGLEVSPYATREARTRGLAVQCGRIEGAQLPPAVFDCITMWDVIEHTADPLRAFTAAAAALRPGGLLALSTGDITSLCARLSGRRWHLFNLPEHLFFFSPASLQKLLAGAGLRVLAMHRDVGWFSLDYLLERLCKTLLGGRVPLSTSWAKQVVLPFTLADIVTLYAERVK